MFERFRGSKSVDLRHFKWIQMSDAWDGITQCSDGYTWKVLVYNTSVVVKRFALRHDGSVESRWEEGSNFWKSMAEVASAYMQVLHIVRAKSPQAIPRNSPIVDTSQEDWDVLYIDPNTHEVLLNHPQFQAVEREFGVELVPLSGRDDQYQVTTNS